MTPKSAPLLQGTLDLIVLQLLRAEPTNGYDLTQRIQAISHDVLNVNAGSLYPALYRIEKKGWVDASWGVSDNQRRAKYYKLTAEGRRQLHKNADTWSNFAHAVARVLGSKQQPAS